LGATAVLGYPAPLERLAVMHKPLGPTKGPQTSPTSSMTTEGGRDITQRHREGLNGTSHPHSTRFGRMVGGASCSHGGEDNRSHTSNLQFGPTLNIGLPNQWSVAFFPSTDIRYNFEWFVPFDVEIAKQWNKNFLTGIEIGVPLFETTRPSIGLR
jgi:hypothetical protein